MEKTPSYNKIIEDAIRQHWELPALSDHGINTFRYKDVARVIEKLHILFRKSGIEPGDKISICGKNSSRWGIAFIATLTYGAVAVPILHEFHPSQIVDIVNHSESRLFFVGEREWANLNAQAMPQLEGIIGLQDYDILHTRLPQLTQARECLNKLFGEAFPNAFTPQDICYYQDESEGLAVINYTSGTTSNSKGVMLPYRALWSNYHFGLKAIGDDLVAGDHVLCMLPMAHMYGMSFEFMFQFLKGVHVHFLTKVASPTILFKALAEVKPRLIVMVPLIIEKIVRKAVFPKIQDPKVKVLLKMPVIGQSIRKKICDSLTQALGGNFYEVIIGGSALNRDVENLLRDIKFPFTVGYGATECAPIITYSDYAHTVNGSCGKVVCHMELRIDSPNPQEVPGEILTRGLNVMLGYYKNPEATATTLDAQGWYHTGDLGIIDAEGNVFIKGRSKNLLLGANGQNIYPEEIEDKLNQMTMVQECVVIQNGQKLYGLVYPDMEQVTRLGLSHSDVEAIMEQNRKDLNPLLPAYAQLVGIKVMDREFEKTPKKSIKRFLYMDTQV